MILLFDLLYDRKSSLKVLDHAKKKNEFQWFDGGDGAGRSHLLMVEFYRLLDIQQRLEQISSKQDRAEYEDMAFEFLRRSHMV